MMWHAKKRLLANRPQSATPVAHGHCRCSSSLSSKRFCFTRKTPPPCRFLYSFVFGKLDSPLLENRLMCGKIFSRSELSLRHQERIPPRGSSSLVCVGSE
eukprot:scaffold9301_cov30-Tisochrysis_lutea.AAC.6